MNTKTEAELQAEIVTLRNALGKCHDYWGTPEEDYSPSCREHELAITVDDALSATADYQGKVVVDEKEWKLLHNLWKCVGFYMNTDGKDTNRYSSKEAETLADIQMAYGRLDSIRGGEG